MQDPFERALKSPSFVPLHKAERRPLQFAYSNLVLFVRALDLHDLNDYLRFRNSLRMVYASETQAAFELCSCSMSATL